MSRTVPDDAYFMKWCVRCQKNTLHVDLMGDDVCTKCTREDA